MPMEMVLKILVNLQVTMIITALVYLVSPVDIVVTTGNRPNRDFETGLLVEWEPNEDTNTDNELLQMTFLNGDNTDSPDFFLFKIHDSATHTLETFGSCGGGNYC